MFFSKQIEFVESPALFAVKSEILVSEGLFPRNQEPEA
jgi:hypothetical protein